MLPGVKIKILNGALGSAPGTADGIAAMLLSGVAVAGKIELNEPKQIFSLADAKDLGITEDYDTNNQTDVYFQIKQFYAEAGEGKELWIMLFDKSVTMGQMTDIGIADNAVKLLNAAKGTIRLLGVGRVPDASYLPTVSGGLDADVWDALNNAQQLANNYAEKMRPLRVIIGGRAWTGKAGDLTDLTGFDKNRCAITLTGQGAGMEDANIGIVLGRLAKEPVQRKISRVKSGSLALSKAYLTDGGDVETHENALDSIHDKGYIIFRSFETKAGWFFSSDHTATANTDDYKFIARGRVIDKVMLIAYSIFVKEVDDDISLNPDGTLPASYIKALQGEIERSINLSMTAKGELTAVSCEIDPKQNILATDELNVKISPIPTGYSSAINIEIGFKNPLNKN